MKKMLLLLGLFIGIFGFENAQIYSQTTNASVNSMADPNAPRKYSTLVNLVNTPIEIERDVAADKYFQEALAEFKAKNNVLAAAHIRDGAQELLKEAPVDEPFPQRKLVEQRIGELYSLSLQVESGLVHDPEILQDKFADADESLAHRYYMRTLTQIEGTPESFADLLLGLSVHLFNSKEYHIAAEKEKINAVAKECASLADNIRQMRTGERYLTPALKSQLDKLMLDVKALKLDE